jgi:D-alanyl-D-alanine carboxypeptidase (penicillin-binding protein 5/6)
MQQPEIAAAVATKQFQFPGSGDKPSFPIFNDNKLLGVYPGFLGGKTGYTDDARHTYVGGAARNGKRIAVVFMRGEQRPTRVVDQAAKLLDYGFALEEAHADPVGQIAGRPTQQADPGNPAASRAPEVHAATLKAAAAKVAADPFGTTGWITTLVVPLLIVAGFVIGHQRKKSNVMAE